MLKPTVVADKPTTPHFPFVFGHFNLSKWSIPYFCTTMGIADAAASLKLVNEFPGWERFDWNLEELYQRDLDWPRVQRSILPYLRDSNRAQFFNSITVALAPVRGARLAEHSEEAEWHPPGIDLDTEKLLSLGPISIGYYQDWKSISDPGAKIGLIRWNPRQVFSVAIDGQHRLAALKEFESQSHFAENRTSVPVILVVLHPDLGFKAPGEVVQVNVLRNLFIDLNKHAKPVSRSRLILLDDNDPTSLCVRATVGKKLEQGTKEIERAMPCLPLTLVDWHTDSARFDEGPYVTTILGLDWAIQRILGTKPIRDFMDFGQVEKQIRALSRSLNINLDHSLSRLSACQESATPFSYSGGGPNGDEAGELAEIVTAFKIVWRTAIVTILTKFRPYERLVHSRQKHGTLMPAFVNWYHLYVRKEKEKVGGKALSEYQQFLGRLQTAEVPTSEESLMKQLRDIGQEKANNLAFNVVFQRALFAGLTDFRQIQPSHLAQLETAQLESYSPLEDDDSLETDWQEKSVAPVGQGENINQRALDYLAALNQVVDSHPEWLDSQCVTRVGDAEFPFWLGTLLRADDGTIDFTQGASLRAADLLTWIACVKLLIDVGDDSCQGSFSDFWQRIHKADNPIYGRLRRAIDRYSRTNGAAQRIIQARQEEFTERDARGEARIRIEWVFRVFREDA